MCSFPHILHISFELCISPELYALPGLCMIPGIRSFVFPRTRRVSPGFNQLFEYFIVFTPTFLWQKKSVTPIRSPIYHPHTTHPPPTHHPPPRCTSGSWIKSGRVRSGWSLPMVIKTLRCQLSRHPCTRQRVRDATRCCLWCFTTPGGGGCCLLLVWRRTGTVSVALCCSPLPLYIHIYVFYSFSTAALSILFEVNPHCSYLFFFIFFPSFFFFFLVSSYFDSVQSSPMELYYKKRSTNCVISLLSCTLWAPYFLFQTYTKNVLSRAGAFRICSRLR